MHDRYDSEIRTAGVRECAAWVRKGRSKLALPHPATRSRTHAVCLSDMHLSISMHSKGPPPTSDAAVIFGEIQWRAMK